MTNIDQFESEFRAASRPVFRYSPPRLGRVVLATDFNQPDEAFANAVRAMLPGEPDEIVWLGSEATSKLPELFQAVDQPRPDLIVTYRNLGTRGWTWPHSLGEAVDVLTQATDTPVLLVPNPHELPGAMERLGPCRSVMAITDHLAGDARLVSHAAAMTADGGTLHLTHVEDQNALERVFGAIAKIPAIDTDTARDELTRRLLADPTEYIEACRRVLVDARPDLRIDATVVIGHRLRQHTRLVEQHAADLVVLNTKDDEQLAMHGLAYTLAVELRRTPLLML